MDKVTTSSKNITPFGGLNLIYNAINKAEIPALRSVLKKRDCSAKSPDFVATIIGRKNKATKMRNKVGYEVGRLRTAGE